VRDITRILDGIQRSDPKAAEELLPLVYNELRKLAAMKMAQEKPGQTLQPTALVHEAWLRLAGSEHQQWNSRGHFFVAAAEAMRRILIDRARSKHRIKHGEGLERIPFEGLDLAAAQDDDVMLRVNDALEKFALEAPEKVELVKLRYFAGFTLVEAALALGLSETTAKRYWTYARAWLYDELEHS
jgi:RNA polymerase sigma factor (TIGR02999 family)